MKTKDPLHEQVLAQAQAAEQAEVNGGGDTADQVCSFRVKFSLFFETNSCGVPNIFHKGDRSWLLSL
jgi:hypothetical protein